jgi:hypothetical protein
MIEFQEIRKLFDIRDDSFGFSEEEILLRENYLDKRLPEILRQYYLQLGKNKQINQAQDKLVLPSELEVHGDGFAIFYYENQVAWQAGVKFSDFDQDNPNVYLSYDQENWDFEIGNLFNFLTSEAYLQALFAFPFNANSHDVSDEKENYIRQNWKKSEIELCTWGTEFFQNSSDEILALLKSENEVDVFIAAKTIEHFLEIDKKLSIDWDYNSLEDE